MRAPLSDEQDAAGETYYLDEQFGKIISSFIVKPGIDLDEFRTKIERFAWIYVSFEDYRARALRTSERKRLLNSLHKKAETLLAALDAVKANIRLTEDLRAAADALAQREGALPGFHPEIITYESISPNEPNTALVWHWAAENQIKKTYEDLNWLVRALHEAEARSQQDMRPAGNRPDLYQHEFVRGIYLLYQTTALEPRKPHFDPISDEERGEFLDFLQACLLPLGINMTRSALLGLYRRAS